MRITVFGAGAIGAMLAMAAHGNGHAVHLVLRGRNLDAVRADGLRVRFRGGERRARLSADTALDPAGADLVVVATKATAHEAAMAALADTLRPGTAVLFVANGLPWWHDPGTAALLDPAGRLRDATGAVAVLGGVMHGSSTVVAPGVVEAATARNRLVVGPGGPAGDAAAAGRARAALDGGVPELSVERVDDLRPEVWRKLATNIATALPAVLSGRDLAALCRTPGTEALVRALYAEALAIAASLGHAPDEDADRFLARIARSTHRPSMLQDDDLGRPMEVATMFEAPLAVARARGVATPVLDLTVPLLAARAARPRD